jgi:hypothetical protein
MKKQNDLDETDRVERTRRHKYLLEDNDEISGHGLQGKQPFLHRSLALKLCSFIKRYSKATLKRGS